MNDPILNWYCLMTFSKEERPLCDRLDSYADHLNINSYCPMDSYEFRPRYRKVKYKDGTFKPPPPAVIVQRPMLQGYIFVRMQGTDHQWSIVRRQRGLYGVMVNQSCPVRIPAHVIEELADRERDVLPAPPKIDPLVTVGSTAKIIRGNWQGQVCPVIAIEGPMATVNAKLFGRDNPLQVPLTFLVAEQTKGLAKPPIVAYA